MTIIISDLTIREAASTDAQTIAHLLEQLGHPISTETVERQLAALASTGCDSVMVAQAEGVVLGVLSLHWTPLLHRDKPLGRITVLVVSEEARGQGVGGSLVREAERLLREAGCSAAEVTSNVRRAEAHAFYLGLGYEQPSAYFRRNFEDQPEGELRDT